MVSERSKSSGTIQEGEFRAITGIGPGIEKRLHDAGILTFEQLGQMSVDEIMAILNGLVGITAEKITQQEWAQQAQKLQHSHQTAQKSTGETAKAESVRPKSELSETLPEEHQDRRYYESFIIELMMDEDRQVHRTRISHTRSGEKNTWAGWVGSKMADWIGSQAGITSKWMAEQESEFIPDGRVQIAELQLVSGAEDTTNHFLIADRPFEVHVLLDLSEIKEPSPGRFACQINVGAHRLGTRQRIQLGKLAQTIHLESVLSFEQTDADEERKILPVIVPTDGLPEGTYRLEVVVNMTAENDPDGERGGIQAILEGELVHVLQEMVREKPVN